MYVVVLLAIGAALLDAVGTVGLGALGLGLQVLRSSRQDLHDPKTSKTTKPACRDQFHQLAMDVEPFPHPIGRQEVLPAGLAELTARKFRFQLVIEVPELQIADEIGLGVGQQGVAGVGRLLLLQRPLARVLHGQRRGNDRAPRAGSPPRRRPESSGQSADRPAGGSAAGRPRSIRPWRRARRARRAFGSRRERPRAWAGRGTGTARSGQAAGPWSAE